MNRLLCADVKIALTLGNLADDRIFVSNDDIITCVPWEKPNQIFYSKDGVSWKQTIFVLGSPRSGKSTLLKLLGSCRLTQFAEEPFDLTVIAQKSQGMLKDSVIYKHYADFFQASLKNHYSELSLGRGYNFRKIDNSYVYNIKRRQDLRDQMKSPRRSDVIKLKAFTEGSFLLALNDVEGSLGFIRDNSPNPRFIWVERPILELAREIASKGWLSNDSLSQQNNLTPAYHSKHESRFGKVYIPYFVPSNLVDTFLELNDFDRAHFYVLSQRKVIMKLKHDFPKYIQVVNLRNLELNSKYFLNNFLEEFNLSMTKKTESIAKNIANSMSGENTSIHLRKDSKVELMFEDQ